MSSPEGMVEPVHPRAAMYPLLYRDGEQVEPRYHRAPRPQPHGSRRLSPLPTRGLRVQQGLQCAAGGPHTSHANVSDLQDLSSISSGLGPRSLSCWHSGRLWEVTSGMGWAEVEWGVEQGPRKRPDPAGHGERCGLSPLAPKALFSGVGGCCPWTGMGPQGSRRFLEMP